MIREAANKALLKSHRSEFHRGIATAILEKFPAPAETQPEMLAMHWTGAGETEAALEAWIKVAKRAVTRRAFGEAEEACRQALILLAGTPESRDRAKQE